jgi:hypothetical protein
MHFAQPLSIQVPRLKSLVLPTILPTIPRDPKPFPPLWMRPFCVEASVPNDETMGPSSHAIKYDLLKRSRRRTR